MDVRLESAPLLKDSTTASFNTFCLQSNLLRGGAPCIENRGIEDNFIFHIECSYFFIHVMKHKCEFNISKQIQPIVCLIFDLRYILTKNTW